MAKGRDYNANKFVQALLEKVVEKGSVEVRKNYILDITIAMEKIVNRQAAKLFPMIVNLMGGKSTGSPYILSVKHLSAGQVLAAQQLRPGNAKSQYKEVSWLPLTDATIKRKTALAKAGKIDNRNVDRFFLKTGELQNYFKTADYRSTLGNTLVTYAPGANKPGAIPTNPGSKKTDFGRIIGVLRFSIFKRIAPYLESVLNGKFDPQAKLEKKAFGAEIGEKLQGFKYKTDHHRALVQPVIHYFVNTLIPNAIATDIARRNKISGKRSS